MGIVGVLLAAGSSSRMGKPNKLLLEYKNHTILEEVITQLLNSELDSLIIITGHESKKIEILIEKFSSDKIISLYNENYKSGRASSIRCAVQHNLKQGKSLLFMVADKPMVSCGLINKALQKFQDDNPDILYVQTPNGRGHPIIFSEKMFQELLNLDGDVTGNSLVEKHTSSTVVLHDEMLQQDIDTYDEYQAFITGK